MTPAKVLVVEDDRSVQGLMLRMLAGLGLETASAANAAEADRCLKSTSFDLVCVGIPNARTEAEAIVFLVRSISGAPILVTSSSWPLAPGLAKSQEPLEFLPRPFALTHFADCVTRLVSAHAKPGHPAPLESAASSVA